MLLQAGFPDVLLLDLQLPDGSGLDLARQIRERAPALPILSAHNQENYINGALHVGARGFVLKDEAPDVLPKAIRNVMRGEVWLSDAVAQKVGSADFPRSPPGLRSDAA
jgi:DNA-binding NarL/FixJ family response regulator